MLKHSKLQRNAGDPVDEALMLIRFCLQSHQKQMNHCWFSVGAGDLSLPLKTQCSFPSVQAQDVQVLPSHTLPAAFKFLPICFAELFGTWLTLFRVYLTFIWIPILHPADTNLSEPSTCAQVTSLET